jgi:hypothetical protein
LPVPPFPAMTMVVVMSQPPVPHSWGKREKGN